MGVNTDYLGHVEIVPNLNQAEYDYLQAFARSRRSYRPGGPYAVSPEDPDTGNGERPWEPGYRGLRRPWLAGERPWRSSLDFPPPELAQIPLPQSTRRRRKRTKT